MSHATRTFRTEVRAAGDGALEISFSSEAPVDMGGVREVLQHNIGAVDLARLNAAAPVLFEHKRETVIGVVERAWVADGKGRARIRFGTSSLAREVAQDVAAGIRRNISVGYQVLKAAVVNGVRTVSRWQPLEISVVSIPADVSVGFGRSHQSINTKKPESKNMNRLKQLNEKRGALRKKLDELNTRVTEANRSFTNDEADLHSSLSEQERALTVSISEENANIQNGARGHNGNQQAAIHDDIADYSILRAIRSISSGGLHGLEAEVSQEVARRSGRAAEGFFVPFAALTQRDMTVTGSTSTAGDQGGFAVSTQADEIVAALRPRMQVAALGATILTGLSGDLRLPRAASGATASWKAETGTNDESSPLVAQVTLSPKRVGTYTDLSKQLTIQTSGGADRFVRNDLLSACAVALDAAAIAGTGASNQPRGILSTSGIGNVAIGTNGGAPTYNHTVDLLAALAAANAEGGTLSFLSNPLVRAKLMKTIFDSGSGLTAWDKAQGLGPWGISNNVPGNLTKGTSSGVCSAIIAGNFSQVIVGTFGDAADLVVDPYTNATSGLVRVVVNLYCDVAVRNPAYFAAILDATTT